MPDLIVNLKVKPNSSVFQIKKYNEAENLLRIDVKSKALKGKANQELLKKIKRALGKEVELVAGEKTRTKKLKIRNCTKEALKAFE